MLAMLVLCVVVCCHVPDNNFVLTSSLETQQALRWNGTCSMCCTRMSCSGFMCLVGCIHGLCCCAVARCDTGATSDDSSVMAFDQNFSGCLHASPVFHFQYRPADGCLLRSCRTSCVCCACSLCLMLQCCCWSCFVGLLLVAVCNQSLVRSSTPLHHAKPLQALIATCVTS
jgi:hypothetical protein